MSNPQMDTKAMAASVPLFVNIDKEDAIFYQLIKDKNIEPKTLQDLERIEKFFNKTLKNILQLVKDSDFDEDEKQLLNARLVLDIHANFADKFGFNFMEVPGALGPWNQEIFRKAMSLMQQFAQN